MIEIHSSFGVTFIIAVSVPQEQLYGMQQKDDVRITTAPVQSELSGEQESVSTMQSIALLL